MIKVLFVCHGNICRSPMAEFLFKDYVLKKGKEKFFEIASAATSSEEIGNHVHYGTKKILDKLGIDSSNKRAIRINMDMYEYYDYIITMDEYNNYNIIRNLGDKYAYKIHRLLEYAKIKRDIADPWYTGNFDDTYNDIQLGIKCFYNYLKENNLIGE